MELDPDEIYKFKYEEGKPVRLPSFNDTTGFPNPAADYRVPDLSLDELCIENPNETYFARATDDSMIDADILPGALMVIDRALFPTDGAIIAADLDGIRIVRRLNKRPGKPIVLEAANEEFRPIVVKKNMTFQIWGEVVASVVVIRRRSTLAPKVSWHKR